MSKTNVQQVKLFENSVFFNLVEFPDWGLKSRVDKDGAVYLWLNWPEDISFEQPPFLKIEKTQLKAKKITSDFLRSRFKIEIVNSDQNKNNVSYIKVFDPSFYIKGYNPPETLWDYFYFWKDESLYKVVITTNVDKSYGMDRETLANVLAESFMIKSVDGQ